MGKIITNKKKIITVALVIEVILTTLLFFYSRAQADAVESSESDRYTRITITLEDERELFPDVLNLNISLTAKASKEADVINILGEVDRVVRDLGFDYSGGTYHVTKNCIWEKDKLRCSGYKGELSYTFRLKDPNGQNRVIETVSRFKDRYGEKVSYTISNPFWSIDRKRQKEVVNILRIELIKKAQDFAGEVSKALKGPCSVSRVDFDTVLPHKVYPPIRGAELAVTGSVEAPQPKAEEQTVSVRARVELVCERR